MSLFRKEKVRSLLVVYVCVSVGVLRKGGRGEGRVGTVKGCQWSGMGWGRQE